MMSCKCGQVRSLWRKVGKTTSEHAGGWCPECGLVGASIRPDETLKITETPTGPRAELVMKSEIPARNDRPKCICGRATVILYARNKTDSKSNTRYTLEASGWYLCPDCNRVTSWSDTKAR